jgi:D-alanyl-D-alanine carboxypeptidase
VRSVRKDVTSWGCNPKVRKAKAKDGGAKKRAAAKKKSAAEKEAKAAAPATITVEPESGDDGAVELRGTIPPPAAAFQAQ